jgi:hypothetical protein
MSRATLASRSLRTSVFSRLMSSVKTLRASCMVMVEKPSRQRRARTLRSTAPGTRCQSMPPWR